MSKERPRTKLQSNQYGLVPTVTKCKRHTPLLVSRARDFFSAPEDVDGLEGVQMARILVQEMEGLGRGRGQENQC